MSTENNTGVQTRAMAQRVDNEANPEQLQRAVDPAMNPTVELHRTKEEAIEEFIRQHGTINLDWYVPDLCNMRVGDLIKKRLQLETMEGRILFHSPALSEFFKTSNFQFNLKTGGVFTYLDPPEDIGIKCQKEPFDQEFLRDTLRGEQDTSTIQEERLKRIPSVKKLVGPADVMPREEAEYKVSQYCHLWMMYADSSVELKKKSELSQESAVAACKMYLPYISDIIWQIEEVVKIFAMEKELRLIKNRGYFSVPQLTPEECKIETIQDKEVLLTKIDEIVVEMLNAIKESEENYKREQEQARIRDEQLRSARQTSRSDINLYPTLANRTPIRNSNTRSDQPGVHFNANPTGTHNNPLFNLLDNNQPRTSTIMHTPHNGTSPAMPADLVEGITQIMNQVTSNNKRDDASKKMMKNIKIFDGSNKAECITWLSQVEAAAKFTNIPFQELICQSMAPAMLHIFSDLSALASDADIKEAILTNYSDIPSTTEAAT